MVPSVPGSVPSPRGNKAQALQMAALPGGQAALAQNRISAEVALFRLGQRLLGRADSPGPGVELLLLFSEGEMIRPEVLMEAVTVFPLGISRPEVRDICAHLRADISPGGAVSGNSSIPLAMLRAAVEAASQGPPDEVEVPRLDVGKLSQAFQQMDTGDGTGRTSLPEFRATLMNAEQYLTQSQLESLVLLTDKDGEGRLLPRTLLPRLPGGSRMLGGPGSAVFSSAVLETESDIGGVTLSLPKPLIAAVLLIRMREKLQRAGSSLTLERVLGVFEVARDQGATLPRNVLAAMLGQVRLGVSIAEANELISIFASNTNVTGGPNSVRLSGFCDLLVQASDPDTQHAVDQLRADMREKLVGRGSALAKAIAVSHDRDYISEAEFRRCLNLAIGGHCPASRNADDEDRCIILADKDAVGCIRWKHFAQAYAGCCPLDMGLDDASAPVICSPKVFRSTAANNMASTKSSWRAAKGRETSSPRKGSAKPSTVTETEPEPRPGACRCVLRFFPWRRG
jgi:Ca2+-binding EF-hand superfamily protein